MTTSEVKVAGIVVIVCPEAFVVVILIADDAVVSVGGVAVLLVAETTRVDVLRWSARKCGRGAVVEGPT